MEALKGDLAKLLLSSEGGRVALRKHLLTGKDITVVLSNGKSYTLTNKKEVL